MFRDIVAMMIRPGCVYMLMSVLLFAVSLVTRYNSELLALPIPGALTSLAITLPIVALLNAYIHPTMLHWAHEARANAPSAPFFSTVHLHELAPYILQALQGILTAILATLLLEGVIASETLGCRLEREWMHLFRAHDGDAIRRVQDALDCCGYNSVVDRAFPFSHSAPSTCGTTYGRSVACRGPWRETMRSHAGIDFAVVVAVGLMQIIGLLMLKEGTCWWTAWRGRASKQANGHHDANRRLLAADDSADEEIASENHITSNGYGSVNGNDHGPRVEPSHLGEGNAWAD